MKQEDQIKYMQMALALNRMAVSAEASFKICETYRLLEKKGDKFSVKDAAEIELKADEIFNSDKK